MARKLETDFDSGDEQPIECRFAAASQPVPPGDESLENWFRGNPALATDRLINPKNNSENL